MPVLDLLDTIRSFTLTMISGNINFSHNIGEVEYDLSKYIIYGDMHKLNQVLRNILSNAIKFTPKGGSITVCVEAYEVSTDRTMLASNKYSVKESKFNRLKISCTDTGPGIAKVGLK